MLTAAMVVGFIVVAWVSFAWMMRVAPQMGPLYAAFWASLMGIILGSGMAWVIFS